MPLILVLFAGLFGLAVGSFLNVVIYRVPRRESVVSPRSACPSCGTPIQPADNIPVVSWLRLRGRCRACGERISARYPAVELLTGLLFAAVAAAVGADWALPAFLVFTASLVAVTVIDLEHYIVPNRIVAVTLALTIPLLALAAVIEGEGDRFVSALIGMVAAGGALLILNLISPAGMGMGDVKLALVLGLLLGWLGLAYVALGLFFGFLLGAIVGLVLIVTGVRSRKDHVPFAPFLASGALLAVLAGSPVLQWYVS